MCLCLCSLSSNNDCYTMVASHLFFLSLSLELIQCVSATKELSLQFSGL